MAKAQSTGRRAAQDAQAAPTNQLSALEMQAVAILGKEAKKTRGVLLTGPDQKVDVLVRLWGTVDVADSQTATVKSTPSLLELLTFIFGQLGPKTRETTRGALVAAFKDGQKPVVDPSDQAFAQAALDLVTSYEQQSRNGNVTGRLEVAVMPGRSTPRLSTGRN